LLFLAVPLLAGACGSGGGSGSSSAYCQQLRNAAEEAKRSTTTSAPNMAALQVAFDKALAKIAKKAPSELKDDYKILSEYVDLRFQAVIDPAKVDQKRIAELDPQYRKASTAIQDYNKRVCKFESTTTTERVTATTTAAVTTTAKPTATTKR